MVLQALGDERIRRAVAFTASGQVRDIQLRLVFRYRAQTPAERELIPDSKIELIREMTFIEAGRWASSRRSRTCSARCSPTSCCRSCCGCRRSGCSAMQVRADQLPGLLQRGLKPLYLVYGDEPLLAQEAGDLIRAAARARRLSRSARSSMSAARISTGAA